MGWLRPLAPGSSPTMYRTGETPPSQGDGALFSWYVIRSNTIHFTSLVVNALYLVGLMVFPAGLRHVLRRVRPNYEWLATLDFGRALVFAANLLIFLPTRALALFDLLQIMNNL